MQKNLSIKLAFDDVFGKEDKYYGEWYLKYDPSLITFLEGLEVKERLFSQLRHLYLYLESLEVLKVQAESKEFSPGKVFSKETWYCCVLLLHVALVDQHTNTKELKVNGLPKPMNDRFFIVMDSLSNSDKKNMINQYNGGKHKTFKKLVEHLYNTRNLFAHELYLTDNAIPQDGSLGFDYESPHRMFPNMSHGRLFLYIAKALILYLGFNGEISISSNKSMGSISDLLRKT